jgi:anthranilate phosphoribosyltransferase
MKQILNHLFDHNKLTKQEAKDVLISISKSEYNETQVASFISVFLMRSITVDELEGFRQALLELATPVDIDNSELIDLCGTGGDGKTPSIFLHLLLLLLLLTVKKLLSMATMVYLPFVGHQTS